MLQDIGVKPTTALVDQGYRGVDHLVKVAVVHRGRHKTMTEQQRRWLKRRQVIEPVIGHAKNDHGMRRCWLKGSQGDTLHVVLCAAVFNIRWLLRTIAHGGIAALLLAPHVIAPMRACTLQGNAGGSSTRHFNAAQ